MKTPPRVKRHEAPESSPGAPASRCAATTLDGTHCAAHPMRGTDLCALHDPATGQAARIAGGRARTAGLRFLSEEQAREIKISDPKAIPDTLQQLARWAATGQLDVRIMNAVTIAAGAATRVADTIDLANRIETLEAALQHGGSR